MFRLLIAYHDREGHVNVPNDHQEEGVALGIWLSRQRTAHRTGELLASRRKKLDSLGVVYELFELKWESMLVHLKEYSEQEGHFRVPRNYMVANNVSLASWLTTQRQREIQGKLDPVRKRRLEDLGVVWRKTKSQQWEEMYNCLVEYKRKEGHPNVPYLHRDGEGPHLGYWLYVQRKLQKENGLDPGYKERLEALGVVWEMPMKLKVPNKTHLAKWEYNFSLLQMYHRTNGHCNLHPQYEVLVKDDKTQKEKKVKLGLWLGRQRLNYRNGSLDAYRTAKLESIEVIWIPRAHNFEEMFSHLVEYKEREGHCNVPSRYRTTAGTKPLGVWLGNVRNAMRKGTLDPKRKERLDEIGVNWSYSQESVWKEMFGLLVRYNTREGNCDVRFAHRENGMLLGHWVSQQRVLKKKGKLAIDRYDALENIGFTWEFCESKWDDFVPLLLKYKERNGDCLVPTKHEEEGKKLGKWVAKMRRRRRLGKLDPSEEKKLSEIGMIWAVDRTGARDKKWNEMFALLLRYKEREGDCLVHDSHQEEGKTLGRWVTRQRRRRKQGLMPSYRESQLIEAGMVWNITEHNTEAMLSRISRYKEQVDDFEVRPADRVLPRGSKWDDMFALLVRYKERKGDCLVPTKHKEEGKNLGNWVISQRTANKRGLLASYRAAQLDDAGMIWDLQVHKTEVMVRCLSQYKEREGDFEVPRAHKEDGKALGEWLCRQRRDKANGSLDPQLSDRLEKTLGVVLQNRDKQRWESMFGLLVEFKNREGHCRVPQKHQEGSDAKNLGQWLDYQRYRKKKGKLDAAYQARLEEIGVKWKIYAKYDSEEDDDGDWGFKGMDHLFDDEDMFG